jgi:AcrR family transcriptional regulator
MFAARGAFDFTLRELAREAGVTHNAPYRHFAGQAELLAALREEGFAALAEAAQQALATSDDPRERVRALGEAYVQFAISRPHHFRLMLHNPLGGEVPAESNNAFAILRTTLEDGRKRGVMRDDLSARELALAAWSLVHGLSSLVVTGQLPSSDASVRRYTKLLDLVFFEGAGAPSLDKGRSRRPPSRA